MHATSLNLQRTAAD